MTVDLVIAGRRIRLLSREGVIISPDERFTAFTTSYPAQQNILFDTAAGIFTGADPGLMDTGIPFITAMGGSFPAVGAEPGQGAEDEPDLIVEVEPEPGVISQDAVKVFDARLMEEVPGGVRNTGEPFWEIFSGGGVTYAHVFLKEPERTVLLEMPHGEKRWRIFAGKGTEPFKDNTVSGDPAADSLTGSSWSGHRAEPSPAETPGSDHPGRSFPSETPVEVNPLPYPLDGLLLYFLFSSAGDIMIHGSGVVSGGRGWLFSGRSGSGKTTMARIFDSAGDRVIHDDRLVLRREDSGWVMHNTPVYRNDEPRSAPLDHLWVIRHGTSNVSEPVAGAEAVAMILANCIQQNWDREAATRLAAAADNLASSVKVSRLSFLPDGIIRDYLLLRSTADKTVGAGAVLSMLDEGRAVTVTAGGYSMWPSIRPGDTVVIGPYSEGAAAAGQIVALRRDGGFVLHRVTEVITAGGSRLISTQGDAVTRADEPAGPEMVAGIVVSVIRRGRQLPPPRRRRPRWFNHAWAELHRLTTCAF